MFILIDNITWSMVGWPSISVDKFSLLKTNNKSMLTQLFLMVLMSVVGSPLQVIIFWLSIFPLLYLAVILTSAHRLIKVSLFYLYNVLFVHLFLSWIIAKILKFFQMKYSLTKRAIIPSKMVHLPAIMISKSANGNQQTCIVLRNYCIKCSITNILMKYLKSKG